MTTTQTPKRQYTYADVEMSEWKKLVLTQYPNAGFRRYPEDEGGGCDAWSKGMWVGDWDGAGGEPAGRILVPPVDFL